MISARCFQGRRHMESGEKSFDSFRNLVIILVVLCYTVIHSMSLRWYVVSEQFNYTKTRVFHAILLPVFIEFSRCIGTYASAKFELPSRIQMRREKALQKLYASLALWLNCQSVSILTGTGSWPGLMNRPALKRRDTKAKRKMLLSWFLFIPINSWTIISRNFSPAAIFSSSPFTMASRWIPYAGRSKAAISSSMI